jgi:hypothetical protein
VNAVWSITQILLPLLHPFDLVSKHRFRCPSYL